MKNVPYTTSTGVKIGYRWNESPKPMPIDDPDMITIQGWFIEAPEIHHRRNLEKIIVTSMTSLAIILMILMGIFR